MGSGLNGPFDIAEHNGLGHAKVFACIAQHSVNRVSELLALDVDDHLRAETIKPTSPALRVPMCFFQSSRWHTTAHSDC